VVAAPPIALPAIAVRADLLPDLDGERVQASLPPQRLSAYGQVILGWVDGTDASLAQSPLIVGARYDGVGDGPGGLRISGAHGARERAAPAPANHLRGLRWRGGAGAGVARLCPASAGNQAARRW
jgi:hypothetical protein